MKRRSTSRWTKNERRPHSWPAAVVAIAGLLLIFAPPIGHAVRAASDTGRTSIATSRQGRWLLPPGEVPAPAHDLAALQEALRMTAGEAAWLAEASEGISLDRIATVLSQAGLEATWYDAPPQRLATLPVPFLAVVEIAGSPRLILIAARRQGWFYLVEPEHGRTLAPYRWLASRAMGPVLPLDDPAQP